MQTLSVAFTSAPDSMRCRVTAVWPNLAALWSAVGTFYRGKKCKWEENFCFDRAKLWMLIIWHKHHDFITWFEMSACLVEDAALPSYEWYYQNDCADNITKIKILKVKNKRQL